MINRCFGNCFGSQEAPCQFVMLGPEGSGKTTLLYSLKIPQWNTISEDLHSLRDVNSRNWDPGYHYEELTSNTIKQYGIWDVPGTDFMISMWPTFYRYVRVTAVLFVVDEESSQDEIKVATTKRHMHFLLNEDELRIAAFILIINTRDEDSTQDSSAASKTMEELLGVEEVRSQPWNKLRFRSHSMNVKVTDGVNNKVWKEIIEDIHKISIKVGLARV
jgi:GTPase SAR1 family protein